MDDRRQSGLWTENPQTGFYKQTPPTKAPAPPPPPPSQGPFQYYQPPPAKKEEGVVRTFADRINGTNGVLRSDSRKLKDSIAARRITEPLQNQLKQFETDVPVSEQLAETQHVNSTNSPASARREPLHIEPHAVPQNVRAKPWSPDLVSPRSQSQSQSHAPAQSQPVQARQASIASNASDVLRRGSVPDRSPLQRLEANLASKEEKRARVEEAEQRVRQRSLGGEGTLARQGTLRSSREGRVVSDGSRRPDASSGSVRKREEDRPRHVSAEQPESGVQRFRKASENLKNEVSSPLKEVQHAQPLQHQGGRQDMSLAANPPASYAPRQEAPMVKESKPRHHAPPPPRDAEVAQYGHDRPRLDGPYDENGAMARTGSTKYKHRARDAGFAGAAAAMAGAGIETAADRGKAAHERRKSQMVSSPQMSPVSPTAPARDFAREERVARSGSKKLQKRPPATTQSRGRGENTFKAPQDQQAQQQQQQQRDGQAYQEQFATADKDAVNYKSPPQTAAGQQARDPVGFSAETSAVQATQQEKHHYFGGVVHRTGDEHQNYQRDAKPLEDWRNAKTARLTAADLEYEGESASATMAGDGGAKDAAWWEQHGRRTSSSGSRQPAAQSAQLDGPYEEQATRFRPPLYLKCGPLLRYTGIRVESEKEEVWRGSIMIVTEDEQSDYSSTPVLRLFAQKVELHQPPPKELLESGQELPPEYEDPVAGQVKLSRTGRPLYVRSVHDIDSGVDLSREENPQGLYAATRTPMLGPQSVSGPDGRESKHITFRDKSRVKRNSGEKANRYREVKAARLHCDRGYTFWRFNIEIELGSRQHCVAYRINKGPAIGFWVPARGETMNIMFHSCNGFTLSVDPNRFSGPDPLWRDVMNRHQARPFHVMSGGGDQIYNDAVMRDCELFRGWLGMKSPEHKHGADFTPEMQNELETFYLNRYAMWFSQGLFAMANSQIPMLNVWDDHDIIDGYGSYPPHFMSSPVFMGLGAVAFKYYMLFQHQSLVTEMHQEEPSWLMGARPGPYISELSRSVFVRLGRKVAFLGVDCRTERTRDEILSQETYDLIFDRLRYEINEHRDIKHLIVLLGVPIAYPRLNFLENVLTSRAMDPIKAIGRSGMLGGFVNKFDGRVEILDDLDDHWTAKHHKAERNYFVQELQELAAEKSVRITILGGDVHLGAVGQFYTPKRFGVNKDKDHRYMPNVISSAIVNTPPPNVMADVLHRRNKVHHLDDETDEDMIPMFDTDVDGSKRGNKLLLPRRNYCMIREYVPGTTPPSTPRHEEMPGTPNTGTSFAGVETEERDNRDRRFPPGSMRRTMSLTRGPANLVRRLSGSGRSKNPPLSLAPEHTRLSSSRNEGPPAMQRSNSMGAPRLDEGSYFPQQGERPVNQFHRRPTNFSVKEARRAAAKGGPAVEDEEREPGHINLEGGLDISLMMEVDQHDPLGSTVPYRLLVPALWYEGDKTDFPMAAFKGRRASLMERIRGRLGRRHEIADDGYSRSPTPSPPPSAGGAQQQFTAGLNDSMEANIGPGFDEHAHLAAYDHDGASDPRRNVSSPPAANSSMTAYSKGYNLAAPPIGKSPAQQSVHNNPYPQSSARRASAPVQSKRQPANETWRHHEDDTEDTLTPSDGYEDAERAARPGMQGRRPSKAERFFGVGEEGGPWVGGGARRPSMQQDGGYVDGTGLMKRKPNWMIWK